jgi:hypothetical protein
VVTRRLAKNLHVSILLLEAGGDEDIPSVIDAVHWKRDMGQETRILGAFHGLVLDGGHTFTHC